MSQRTEFRTCPLCEAICGLEITATDTEVIRVRGDRADVFSKGFICPKGSAVAALHTDPDRLRVPMVRDRSGGGWREVSWPGWRPRWTGIGPAWCWWDGATCGPTTLGCTTSATSSPGESSAACWCILTTPTATRPGVNSNILADPSAIEPLTGNAMVNGIPVTFSPV